MYRSRLGDLVVELLLRMRAVGGSSPVGSGQRLIYRHQLLPWFTLTYFKSPRSASIMWQSGVLCLSAAHRTSVAIHCWETLLKPSTHSQILLHATFQRHFPPKGTYEKTHFEKKKEKRRKETFMYILFTGRSSTLKYINW